MALLNANAKFDMLRGWPREGAIDEAFKARVQSGTPDTLPAGTVVFLNTDGAVQRADRAVDGALTGTKYKSLWLVITGNETGDYDGMVTGKVTCLRGNCMVRLAPANYKAGQTYTIGMPLTYGTGGDAGLFVPAASGQPVIGEVIRNDITIDSTLVIMYMGAQLGAA